MKKGFTLIELLAVIVVLGVIGVITIPIFNNFIETSRTKAFKESEKALIRATRNYLNFNEELYPINNEVRIVSIKTLQDQKFVDRIKSPSNNNCSGYVAVVKNYEGNYQFSPHYQCDGTIIESPSSDGLILNYTFDDFKEPTDNFMTNPKNLVPSNFGSYGFGDTNTHTQITLSDETYFGANAIKVTRLSSQTYMTAATTAIKLPRITFAPGEKVTFSVYAKAGSPEVIGKIMHLHIYGTKAAGGNFSLGVTQTSKPMTSQWQRFEATITNNDVTDWTTTNVYLRLNSGTLSNGEYYVFSSPQLEKKGYATPFVDGVRTATLTDYSNTGKIANISATAPPTWIYDKERESGAYLFNNNIINFGTGNTFFPLNTFTISTWIKTPGLGSGMSLNGIVSITYGLTLYLNSTGTVGLRMDNGTALPAITANRNLNDNQFHHIAAMFDGTNAKIFIDGNLIISSPFTGWTGSTRWPTNTATIGQENNNGPIYRFNGVIDNLKIYNRALTNDQVKDLYLIEKRK